ncbi:hypothetical protein ACFXI8_27200 [Streptomyces niveus]|uniref:hypothetical protein n=1 Tax=Streptomyces niveus TaxID=193462 RepID=UPI0036B4D851
MGLSLRSGREVGRLPNDPWPQWSYAGFNQFRRRLAEHIGIDLNQMDGYGGGDSWDAVDSPLRHLLDHSDCDGELSPEQAAEVAPALHRAMSVLSATNDSGDFLWSYDREHGEELVQLLELCAREKAPVLFR